MRSSRPFSFNEVPIDRSRDEIRLFRYEPCRGEGIQLVLRVYPRDASSRHVTPPYIALSYAWESPHDTKPILINGKDYRVTANLHDFLTTLRENADFDLETQWFWADEVCIDQGNMEERGHQVNLMSQIYWSAIHVLAYLGLRPHETVFVREAFSTKLLARRTIEQKTVLMLLDVFTREYWVRLWIIQELRLAQDIRFWCGDWSFTRRAASRGLTCLEELLGESAEGEELYTPNRRRSSFPDWVATFAVRDHVTTFLSLRPTLWLLLEDHYQPQIEHRYETLHLALQRSRESQCTDARDKVFGILALVEPAERVTIDYSLSLESVVLEAARIIVEHGRFHMAHRAARLADSVEFNDLIRVLSLAAHRDMKQEVWSLYWSYKIASLTFVQGTGIRDIDLKDIDDTAVTENQIAFARQLLAKCEPDVASGLTSPEVSRIGSEIGDAARALGFVI